MALSVWHMQCERCAKACGTRIRGRPGAQDAYVLGTDALARVMRADAWCPACRAVVNGEAIPDQTVIGQAIARLGLELAWADEDVARDGADGGARRHRTLVRILLASEADWRAWARAHARRPGRCGRCDAFVEPLQPAPADGAGLAWVHPGCGGAMRWRADGLRLARPPAGARTLRYYLPDGRLEGDTATAAARDARLFGPRSR